MSDQPWKTDQWWVSQHAHEQSDPIGEVSIYDLTLRDGEQQAGVALQSEEKVEIGTQLAEAGVQRIEAGMIAMSEADQAAIRQLAAQDFESDIYAQNRALIDDIDLSLELGVDGIMLDIPASTEMITSGYNWTREETIDKCIDASQYAKDHGLDVSFFSMDTTRAELDEYIELVNAVAQGGAMDSLVVIDTFGVTTPDGMGYIVDRVTDEFDIPVEVHAHNDFGLALANSMAAVQNGAEVIHTCMNGLGERAGNAPLEEVVFALELLYDVETGVTKESLSDVSRTVEDYSQSPVPRNKPIVGDGLFTLETGILGTMMERSRDVPEFNRERFLFPFVPSLVDREVEYVTGKFSGKASIRLFVEHSDLDYSTEEINDLIENHGLLQQVKQRGYDQKRPLTEAELNDLIEQLRE